VNKAHQILVIDDSASDRKIYRRYLSSENGEFTMEEASNSADGLVACKRLQPDLIILDFRLPDLDGINTLGALREFYANPVVFISGNPEPSTVTNAFHGGAISYLSKDLLSREKFLEVVRNALRK
jgi:CheY-like chemotaxis protein